MVTAELDGRVEEKVQDVLVCVHESVGVATSIPVVGDPLFQEPGSDVLVVGFFLVCTVGQTSVDEGTSSVSNDEVLK